jgi:hypothetical protein
VRVLGKCVRVCTETKLRACVYERERLRPDDGDGAEKKAAQINRKEISPAL